MTLQIYQPTCHSGGRMTRTEKLLVAFVCLLLAVLIAENVAIVLDTMLNPVRVCAEGKP
ncbi:hypothetical protein LBMAG38_13830 [Chloroflexota bacterium]|nr:hypothetical protein LBMAG38_13830 [Chloroflexota bacterium]